MSWKPEVISADDPGQWLDAGLRFATRDEAEAVVQTLRRRWLAVRETRVVESEDPVNYREVDGEAQDVKPRPDPLWG
jgi:hypothetical protein